MSRPIPQSRFGDKYQDSYDRIFGPKEEKQDEPKKDESNENP